MEGKPGSRRDGSRDREADAFDGRLIRALQEDGRASIHSLAQELDVSRDFVAQRLRSLIDNDGLRVVAALDPSFTGHHVLIHTAVSVDGPVRPVAERIAKLPDVVFVSLVSGNTPLVMESRHRNIAEMHATLEEVRQIPAVRQMRVNTYDGVLKGFFIATSHSDIPLDRTDHTLIAALQHDGRASFAALASVVHLSPSSARARVRRLVNAGVIRISAIKSGGLSRSRLAIGIGVTARGDLEPIRELIVASPAIDFAARCHGTYDFVATVVGASSADVLALIEKIRALPEVGSLETWTHLDLVKEDYAPPLGRVINP